MPNTTTALTVAGETYFADLGRVRASGGATGERSSYGPLANLLNAVGATLAPKVFCVGELADQGAGHPDFGLYAAKQVQQGRPREAQVPERGVVEVKAAGDDAWLTAAGDQVSRYWGRYRLVLVTNTRDFVLVGEDAAGRPTKLETFRLAADADTFVRRLETPRAFAREVGAGLGEYLTRALSHRAALAEPKDLAWLLASYARDGLARVETAGDSPPLAAVRAALEDALGVRFEGERGARFFHSTLVQTLFYGVFSAWVLWSRADTASQDRPLFAGGYSPAQFDWRTAVWHLRAPVLRALFQQLSDPGRLQPLGLVEVLDWTAAALNRVDRAVFFARFTEGEAVPYFYEPFLEAFDPELRKELGVWYTPPEVVRYMVARVDRAVRDDLGIADGLAAENVYVLDPCCGTGAYLAEVLRRIAANLASRGLGALAGARVKQAAVGRVFGFEIMPAAFVVAHLQIGLTLQDLDAPLADDGTERAGVFLTNALTGWEPRTTKPLPFPELEEERDRADQVKQETPILVILGNPPYNGFAGMAVDEERDLSDAYRTTRRVRRPEGQGLNDLYVRFFRMAERRIAEKTGRGVVCFISNYSWLDSLSFTGMRERYLESFDAVRIDCLNGDSRKTGKTAPDGSPDPSIFSTEGDPVGIQVGTAITTLVRKANHAPADTVGFRHLWGQAKRADLTATAEDEPGALYEEIAPILPLGLPFVRTAVSEDWFDWPALPDLFPVSFPGVKTSRDGFLVDVDLARLRARVADYFDARVSHEEIARRYPGAMKTTARFDARAVRDALLARGGPKGRRLHPLRLPAVRYALALLGSGYEAPRREARRLQAACVRGESVALRSSPPPKGCGRPAGRCHVRSGRTPSDRMECKHVPRVAPRRWSRNRRCRGSAPSESLRASATLSRPSRRGGEGSVPPRSCHAPRSRLPHGQCWCASHGVATHPAAGLAGWRGRRGGDGARGVSHTRPRTCPVARFRHARTGRHRRHAAPGDRRPRCSHHPGRASHDGRRFRTHGGVGALRIRGCRNAGPRPSR